MAEPSAAAEQQLEQQQPRPQPQPQQEQEQEQQQQHDDEQQQAPLSKRQQKRLAKQAHKAEVKRARREREKEDKAAALQQKRTAIGAMLDGMSEEERQAWSQKQKEKKQGIAAQRAATKARQQQALSAPQRLVIDLSFPGLMTPTELKSLCQQLSYSYSTAVNGEAQMHLHLLGASDDVEAALHKQLPGHVHWAVTKSEQGYAEFFKDSLDSLVYLTADAPDEVAQLDPAKVYIIGGIVDRNRHKGICYERAQAAGVATARLPIAQHVKLQTSAVITVNQVVDILSRMQRSTDWRAELEAVLPCRKRAADAGGDGDAGSGAAAAAGAGSECEPDGAAAQAGAATDGAAAGKAE